MKDLKKNQRNSLLMWIILALAMITLFNLNKGTPEPTAQPLNYSEFLEKVQKKEIKDVTIEGDRNQNITGYMSDGSRFKTYAPKDDFLVTDLVKNGVKIKSKPEEGPSMFWSIFMSWGPILLLIGVWIYFMRAQRGGANPMSFGKNRARMMDPEENKVTFADVAGCDEAKGDVEEIVEFLRDPTRFQKLGGRIPKGALMVGPPGTGKTLLARAIAGEAKVPFFSISGSDFVEMFVGVGASRVREMFAEAKKHAPCIIFIDEIDAVGRHRGAGVGGGNDEREQTLNQLLVEMDGFEGSSGIIILGATNRVDVLDKALLRPGRLDRQVVVGLPDIRGREQVLSVHTRKVPISNEVKLKTLARGTPGFSGADLANLVNEAALFAARRSAKLVEMRDFESAKDKLIMGAERKSVLMPEKERRNTAYHESGHAIVAKKLPGTDPVHKVTIIPRGQALGVTMQLPEEDRYSHDKEHLLNQIAILFGGRIAEEIFMKQMTTGASNDFERATYLARKMVTSWGMSDLGIMVMSDQDGSAMFGSSVPGSSQSQETMREIETEIKRILNEQYNVAKTILIENRDQVEAMTAALLEIETIEFDQIEDICAGRPFTNMDDYEEKRQESNDRRAKLEKDRAEVPAVLEPVLVDLNKEPQPSL